MRIFKVVWIFYWVYGAALVYLATVTILQSEAGLSLPLSSVTTVTNLLPYVSLGLLWMVILNIYRIRLKKPAQNKEAEA